MPALKLRQTSPGYVGRALADKLTGLRRSDPRFHNESPLIICCAVKLSPKATVAAADIEFGNTIDLFAARNDQTGKIYFAVWVA
jgi:hypothetical protein